jgi:CheY-like chemotaxis protein
MAEPVPQASEQPKTTVMVVEPDVLVRLAIADYLRGCGYIVIEARSAEEVFTVLDSGCKVDVVFAEVDLPEMSGFDLAKNLRVRDPAIGVILAYGAEGAAEKAGELCEDGPISKPYAPAEVLRRIRLLREGKR